MAVDAGEPRSPAQPRATAAGQRWLTAQGVADMYSVSRHWVYVNKTRIGYTKMGNGQSASVRFDPGDVERFMAQRFYREKPRPGRPRKASRETDYRVELSDR